jgi:VWFA-related protein
MKAPSHHFALTRKLYLLTAGLVASCCGIIALAQTIRVDVQLHQMTVTVTDESGGYVTDLQPEDFVLQVNNTPQKIELFVQDAETPITLGLLVDSSASMKDVMGATTEAARAFIRSFRPSDEFFVATFAHSLNVRQGLTQDKDQLSATLSSLRVANGDTHLLGSVLDAVKLVRKGRNRKRALVVVTDGMDTTCQKNLQPFKDGIRSSETLIYGIHMPVSFLNTNAMTVQILSHCTTAPGANDFFAAIESETGGRTFETRPRGPHFDEQLDGIFDTISLELRGQYTIGFYSKDPTSKLAETVRIRPVNSSYHIRSSSLGSP